MRIRPTKAGKSRVKPDVNVTPLVDVVLVLLIIFMVLQSELEHGKPVEMPGVTNADKQREPDKDDITVTVVADGTIFLGDTEVTRDQLVPMLKALKNDKPLRHVMLKGDQNQPYGAMRRVFKDIADAGWVGVRLLVGERDTRTRKE